MRLPKGWQHWKLGARLQWLRERLGLTQVEAAARIKIVRGHLCDLESGKSDNPRLRTLLAIVNEYDISTDELTIGLYHD